MERLERHVLNAQLAVSLAAVHGAKVEWPDLDARLAEFDERLHAPLYRELTGSDLLRHALGLEAA